MTCFVCKGHYKDKNTNFTADLESCIIIKNVPSQVCSQCGEISYSDEVAKELERIVNSFRSVETEIVVVNYPKKYKTA